MELQALQPSPDNSNQDNKFLLLVNKTVQRLECMKHSDISDYRPKTKSALSNALLPLCNVLFICDIDKALENMDKSKHILLYSGPSTSTKFFTPDELLTKMSEHAVRTAQKQNRILTLANRGTPAYSLIESQMERWKKEFTSTCKTSTKVEHMSSLMTVNFMAGDLEADAVITKLIKYGIVEIAAGENVTYNLPNDSTVEASFQDTNSQFAVNLGLKAPVTKKGNHGTSKLPAVLYLHNMVLNSVMLLKKCDDHKPKTVKALRKALEPILRVLHIVNPQEFLMSLAAKIDVKEKLKTKKRKFSDVERGNSTDKVKFEIIKPSKMSSVSLGNILSKTGITTGNKVPLRKGKAKQVRKFERQAKRKSKQVSEEEHKKIYVQDCVKKAAHLNRVLILGDDEEMMLKCEQRINKWIQTLNSKDTEDVDHSTREDATFMESESHVSENMETDVNNDLDKERTEPTSKLQGKAFSAKQILNKLTSLACFQEQLNPCVIIKLLENIGYCKIENNQVFYAGIDRYKPQ